MMGGGFGGCCIVLVDPARADTVAARLHADYAAKTSKEPHIMITSPGAGAAVRKLGHPYAPDTTLPPKLTEVDP
jgi:galactokinase